MKPITLVGIVLILFGIAGLAFGHISFTTKEKVLDFGPIHATADKEHRLPIPDIAAVVAVVAGLGLVVAGQKRA